MFSAIWAQDTNGLIGKNDFLPWRLPNDLKFFKEKTLGKTLVMGRKTFEGMGARPLPNRKTIVLTKDVQLKKKYTNVEVLNSVEEVLRYAESSNEDIWIVGGASIYKVFEPYISTIYQTVVQGDFEGDAYFPEWHWKDFQLVEEQEGIVDEKNVYSHTFFTYQRK